MLLNLNKNIKESDASLLAKKAIFYSSFLKNKYKLVKPPLYHNFLVNIGLKKRGLCWHFAYDMLKMAKNLKLNSFDYYIGGANINNYWSEHNSLVVTCKGCSFEEGIVMDPWRKSGELYFNFLKNDKEYKWNQRGSKR